MRIVSEQPDPILDRLCERCGLTYGAHRGDQICHDQCPLHEGGMDWPSVGVTTFVASGQLGKVPRGTPSLVGGAA